MEQKFRGSWKRLASTGLRTPESTLFVFGRPRFLLPRSYWVGLPPSSVDSSVECKREQGREGFASGERAGGRIPGPRGSVCATPAHSRGAGSRPVALHALLSCGVPPSRPSARLRCIRRLWADRDDAGQPGRLVEPEQWSARGQAHGRAHIWRRTRPASGASEV